MKQNHAARGILVLESPWELDEGDANRSSVLPFVDGIAKAAGDTEVCHANFYDWSSFQKALRCLCKARYRNTIIYIAAHGTEKSAGGVKVIPMFLEIAKYAAQCNITGVVLGSCFTAKDAVLLEACIEESPIRWCAGYASSALWLPATLVDCSILEQMSDLDDLDLNMAHAFVDALGRGLAPFAPRYPIGLDKRKQPVALEESMQFVIQPAGQGHRARNVSDQVFAAAQQCRLP